MRIVPDVRQAIYILLHKMGLLDCSFCFRTGISDLRDRAEFVNPDHWPSHSRPGGSWTIFRGTHYHCPDGATEPTTNLRRDDGINVWNCECGRSLDGRCVYGPSQLEMVFLYQLTFWRSDCFLYPFLIQGAQVCQGQVWLQKPNGATGFPWNCPLHAINYLCIARATMGRHYVCLEQCSNHRSFHCFRDPSHRLLLCTVVAARQGYGTSAAGQESECMGRCSLQLLRRWSIFHFCLLCKLIPCTTRPQRYLLICAFHSFPFGSKQ